jgi:hypothetical protein
MFLLSLTATCQVYTVSLKAGLYTYNRFAPRTLDPPDGHPTQAHTHIMGVARQAPAPSTGGLMLQLEAEGQKEGEDALEKRLAIAQQVEVGGFVSKIDSDGAVVSCRFGCCTHMSPSVIRARTLMGHDGGNALQSQELCAGLRALPLNSMECVFF